MQESSGRKRRSTLSARQRPPIPRPQKPAGWTVEQYADADHFADQVERAVAEMRRLRDGQPPRYRQLPIRIDVSAQGRELIRRCFQGFGPAFLPVTRQPLSPFIPHRFWIADCRVVCGVRRPLAEDADDDIVDLECATLRRRLVVAPRGFTVAAAEVYQQLRLDGVCVADAHGAARVIADGSQASGTGLLCSEQRLV